MGYRSNLAIALSKKAVEKMPQKVKDNLEDLGYKTELGKGGCVYEISGVKWYSFFDDVKSIDDFLESLDSEKGEYYELLRIGEDDDDSEHRGNGELQMWIDRTINTDDVYFPDDEDEDEQEQQGEA